MAPIKSTKFGYMSIFTDKVETDNNIAGIGATYSTSEVFEPGNGYRYLIYTAPGYLNVNRGGSVDLLVVGGGGGGGRGQYSPPSNYFGAGGGGAGGYFEDFNFTIPIGEYDISIGAGGGVVSNQNVPGVLSAGLPGTPTYIIGPGITSITAYGGGGGAGAVDSPNLPGSPGSDGGSGGGGSGHNGSEDYPGGTGNRTSAQYTATGSPIPAYLQGSGQPQGNDGGAGASPFQGGGGGGAGAAGGTAGGGAADNNGGDGRAAWTNDAGIPPSYGTPGPAPGRYFAGGGGGGYKFIAPNNNGGAGGGGQGHDDYPPTIQDGTAGTVNTGGGGGGGDGFDLGQPGGSGIVIIRYRIE